MTNGMKCIFSQKSRASDLDWRRPVTGGHRLMSPYAMSQVYILYDIGCATA